ncbi:hypothetical protein OIY81_871 [Cryptosporidium canis]|nr:hypothetical protein OIY81_871 [Cryptosporidium canis]
MEIVTHDDTESIKFIHGPRFRLADDKAARILICNTLKYLIIEKDLQITIFNINAILSKPSDTPYFESSFDELSHAKLGNYSIHDSSVSHITLDFSSTILTVVTEKKIILFNLLNIDKEEEWASINHNGIKSIIWTRNNDIITIDTDGQCYFYQYIPSRHDFFQIKLTLDALSDEFSIVEACNNNSYEIEFILITETEKNIIFVTSELYSQIISSKSKSFVIPKAFYKIFSTIIEPMLDIFPNDTCEINTVEKLHIASAKIIDGNDLYLSIILIGRFECLDGYVLFFNIDNNLNISLISYSVNDLCFDNVDPGDIEQIKQINCVSIWVKEWKVLFIGSSVFSQMILFTCDHSYVNKEDLQEYIPHTWIRLAMCEGYDINCTDFDIGIFDSCIYFYNPRSIKDPKQTIDSPDIIQPPIIFISETNGNIITHYISGNLQLIRNIQPEKLNSLIRVIETTNHRSIEKQDKAQLSITLNNNSAKDSTNNSNSSCGTIDPIKRITVTLRNEATYRKDTIIYKSVGNLLDSILKVESQVLNLEKKFIKINHKIVSVLKSPISQDLMNLNRTIKDIEPASKENEDFDRLISKFNEISNIEIQLRRLQLYFMKKISDEIYKNTKVEILKEKLRKNELTSSQISILFQYDTELFVGVHNHADVDQKILNSLSSIEKRSLKLASRISQISKFCGRLNYRRFSEREFTLLPPSEYKALQEVNQNYKTPEKTHFDSPNTHQPKATTTSSVRILSNMNYSSISESRSKYRISSLRNNINLTEIINNISNSVVDKLHKHKLSPNNKTPNAQELKIDNYANILATPNRYFQIRSKPIGNFFNNSASQIRQEKFGHSVAHKNTPFFSSSWTPGSKEENHSIKLAEYSNNAYEIDNKYLHSAKFGNANSIFTGCFERLERITDHCEIANGSISFIEREELLPIFIKKADKYLVSNLEDTGNQTSNCDRFITSQLLLNRNSSLQKNMEYRQKLSLIILGFIDSQSDYSKPMDFLQHTGGNNDFCFLSRSDDSLVNTQPWDNILNMECEIPDNSTWDTKKDRGLIPTHEIISIERHTSFNKSPSVPTPSFNPELQGDLDSKSTTKIEHENEVELNSKFLSEPAPIDNKGEISVNKVMGCDNCTKVKSLGLAQQKIDEGSKYLETESSNISEFTNDNNLVCISPTEIDTSRSDDKKSLTANSSKSIPIENGKKNTNESVGIEDEVKSVLFPLSLTNSETPNSKRASEGLFTFSTEMNISINLTDPISEKNLSQHQTSESNIFSFCSDTSPLKPIDYVTSFTRNDSENNLLHPSIGGPKKIDVLSALDNNAIERNNSVSEIKDTNNGFKCTNFGNVLEPNVRANSTAQIGISGGAFTFPSFITNFNNAPTTSGFGSSPFLTSGPFCSNSTDDLSANTKNITFMGDTQFLGSPKTELNVSTPFNSHPSPDNSAGGFASLSSEFHGFSSISTQNTLSSSFSTNPSNIFNFAPPQKPRQVNKLD